MCLGRVEDAGTKCLPYLANGRDVFWAFMDLEKAWYVADSKSEQNSRKIVESSAEFLYR